MDINPNDKCIACGKLRSSLPIEMVADPSDPESEPQEVQRFALWNAQWEFFICPDDLETYNAVEPLASQWPLLKDNPEAQKSILDQVFEINDRAYKIFKGMTV